MIRNAISQQKWVLAIALFVILLLSGLQQYAIERGIKRSLQEQVIRNRVLLHALEDSVVRSLQSVNSVMSTLAESLPKLENSTEITGIIREQLRMAPQLRSIDLLNLQGKALASATSNEGKFLEYACIPSLVNNNYRDYQIDIPKYGRYPGDPFSDRKIHKHIPFCVSVKDRSGNIIAILLASINPQYFTTLFEAALEGQDGSINLYRYDGETLISTAGIALASDRLKKNLEKRSWGEYRINPNTELAALVSYRSTSSLPLIITIQASDWIALEAWKKDERILSQVFLGIVVLIFIVSIFIVILLRKRDRIEGDNRLLGTAIRSAANAIFITDRKGSIHWVNEAFLRLTGYSFDDVEGKNPRMLNSGLHTHSFFKMLWQSILAGESWRGELVNRHKDGSHMVVEQTVTPIFDNNGNINHFVAVHEDVTARKQAEQKALYLSEHDPLTGLPNRRSFEHKLHSIFSSTNNDSAAILFIDLDRFKEVNDTLGHEAGDALLKATTKNLSVLLNEQYMLYRLGGDEFAILVYPCIDKGSLSILARDTISAVAQPFIYSDSTFTVTCSVGIAYSSIELSDYSLLLRQADMAMYRAKNEGKNTYQFFDSAMDELVKRRFFLQQQLEIAVKSDDKLSIKFQPQIKVLDGSIYGAEALLRWKTDNGEWVSPVEFIHLAEETGLIFEVGHWLIDNVLCQMADWNSRGVHFGCIALNISAIQLSRGNITKHLIELMKTYAIPSHQISIEITETTLMVDSERVRHNLKQLKKSGLKLAIDDFGTGYSSLSYLKKLNADYLKIDRSFIIGIGKDQSDENIVAATIALAHQLGLKTIAEGVDSPPQQQFLLDRNCDIIQGFLYSKPISAKQFEKFISK